MLVDGFEKEKVWCGGLVAEEVKRYIGDESFASFSTNVSLLQS
jgi:hypothetical protein